jgi:hypothetical protein
MLIMRQVIQYKKVSFNILSKTIKCIDRSNLKFLVYFPRIIVNKSQNSFISF